MSSLYMHKDTPNSSVPEWCTDYGEDPAVPPSPCFRHQSYCYQYHTARSYHPGGVNVVFCDGHVDFYSDTVDLHVWQSLGTIDDGNVLGEHEH